MWKKGFNGLRNVWINLFLIYISIFIYIGESVSKKWLQKFVILSALKESSKTGHFILKPVSIRRRAGRREIFEFETKHLKNALATSFRHLASQLKKLNQY